MNIFHPPYSRMHFYVNSLTTRNSTVIGIMSVPTTQSLKMIHTNNKV